jgi:TetR/AcrR family transcriptional regulator, transcriptional repressor for nem operon
VRYRKARKRETRRRIIQTASRRFKRDGIDGSGIAPLMSDAGLTNGQHPTIRGRPASRHSGSSP